MPLSVCLVTRNHAPSLGAALRSVAGLSAEVVVADTGSTDDTVRLATAAGCRVVHVPWADDFSAACNAALDAATGDRVLWLNPDEEVEAESLKVITLAVVETDVFAWRLLVREQLRPRQPDYGTTSHQTRLFRRDPAVRYRGRLHPTFVTPIEEIAAARGLLVASANAVIRRHAYLSRPTPDKVRWVVRLIEAELRDRPGQLGLMIELGRNLLWMNDPRGHTVLAEATDEVRRHADAPTAPSPWVGSLIEYLTAGSSDVLRAEARSWADRWFPNSPPALWAVAHERFAAADFPAAAERLGRLVEMGRTGRHDQTGFDPAIVGPAAVQNLGICFLHLGRWDEAKACFAEAVNDPERRTAAQQGLRYADQRQVPPA